MEIKTAAFTIFKNDISKVKTWLHYAKQFKYKIILDIGSVDGTWELLQQFAKDDPYLIIEQKNFDDLGDAKNYNLTMIPSEIDWLIELNSNEWFQLGTYDYINYIINNSQCDSIGCTKLELNEYEVWNGPPNKDPHFRIYKKDSKIKNSIYCDKFFLIKD